ncbi:MAG: hypothetical protein CMD81_06425 [Gammaproteobacteria bacterium]|nr:hypothetical protein [Gammaproteobacteria bacterium]HBF08800.1 hypothetical protein [Gammaproteobacteria bacterium]
MFFDVLQRLKMQCLNDIYKKDFMIIFGQPPAMGSDEMLIMEGSVAIDDPNPKKFDLNIMKSPLETNVQFPMGANFKVNVTQNMRDATYYTNSACNQKDFDQIEPLIKKHNRFNTDKLQSVLEGVNPNCKSSADRQSLLHVAAQRGNVAATSFLISAGVCLDSADKNKNTPLIEAVKNNHPEEVKLLVAAGANVYTRNIQGDSALAIAEKKGRKDCSNILRATQGHLSDAYRQYTGGKAMPRAVADGETTEYQENISKLQTLLDAQVFNENEFNQLCDSIDVNKSLFANGNTVLHEAAQRGHIKAIDILLARGADIESVQCARLTPMLVALQNKHEDVALHLFSKGANPFARSLINEGVLDFNPNPKGQFYASVMKKTGNAIV